MVDQGSSKALPRDGADEKDGDAERIGKEGSSQRATYSAKPSGVSVGEVQGVWKGRPAWTTRMNSWASSRPGFAKWTR